MNLPYNYNTTSNKKSAAKITIQKYYLPSGESTQIQGVKSDISMPSINHFLPIGESDLENALVCDSINPVNFRRPVNEFVYNDSDITNLLQISLERQKTTPEFKYLSKSVDWYKEKRNKTNLSINIKNRLNLNIEDQKLKDSMNKEFDQLTELAFLRKDITLDIVNEQNLKSLSVRGDSNNTADLTNIYSAPSSLDIRLHESLRVMSDWINLIEDKKLTHQKDKKI